MRSPELKVFTKDTWWSSGLDIVVSSWLASYILGFRSCMMPMNYCRTDIAAQWHRQWNHNTKDHLSTYLYYRKAREEWRAIVHDCAITRHQTLLDSWGVATSGSRIILSIIYPTCHAYYELRTKNENRRTKEEQKSTDEGWKTKIKDENCTTGPPYTTRSAASTHARERRGQLPRTRIDVVRKMKYYFCAAICAEGFAL